MPTPSYAAIASAVTVTDLTIGAGADETGILLGDLSYTHNNPKIEHRDRFGGVIGKTTNYDPSIEYTVDGVVTVNDTGVNIHVFTAGNTLANVDFFASAASTYNTIDYTGAEIILDGVSGTQPAGGERTISNTYIRNLGLVIT